MPFFEMFGLIQLGIKPVSFISVADVLSQSVSFRSYSGYSALLFQLDLG